MQYVPAISLLITFIIIFILILWRFPSDKLLDSLKGKNAIILSVILLFVILSIIHLFQPQTWTADVLKVVVGVLVGVASSYTNDEKKAKQNIDGDVISDISASGTFGDNTKIAGRDINETIENMKSDISQIKDSIINQYTSIANSLLKLPNERSGNLDYLINTIYERFYQNNTAGMTKAVERVINHWQEEGWEFSSLTSDYSGIDGMVLLFTRPSSNQVSSIAYYHGSQMERLN